MLVLPVRSRVRWSRRINRWSRRNALTCPLQPERSVAYVSRGDRTRRNAAEPCKVDNCHCHPGVGAHLRACGDKPSTNVFAKLTVELANSGPPCSYLKLGQTTLQAIYVRLDLVGSSFEPANRGSGSGRIIRRGHLYVM